MINSEMGNQITKAKQELCTDFLGLYLDDPVFFVEHALGHYTWSKQREILRSVRDNKGTAVRACHGSSKTFTAAELTAWFLSCFEHSKVITTAPTFPQVEMLLWAEINDIYRTSRIKLPGTCMVTRIKTEDPNHYALGFSTDKPARAEGWHAPEILFIFDEAKGIPSWLWDSVQGLMTGGMGRWLVISTTDGVQVGEEFYKAFKDKNSDWNKIHIKASDTPYCTGELFQYIRFQDEDLTDFERYEICSDKVNIQIAGPEYIQTNAKKWGRQSPLFITKVEGELYDLAADTLIKLSQVLQMFTNAGKKKFDDTGAEEVGVDVGRGGDDTVFIGRKGLKVKDIQVVPAKELPEKARLVYQADELCRFVGFKKHIKIKIDDTGVGGGLTDIMESRGYNIVPINFQERANDEDTYPNCITEMWYTVATMIQDISCPEDDRLQTELVNRKYKDLDRKGRRVIESKDEYKKRGFPSPDMADAFLLAFYDRTADDIYIGQSKEDWY